MSARLASWLLYGVAALAPLPFGSNEPTAIAFWCIVLAVCLVLAPAPSFSPGRLGLFALAVLVVVAYAFVLREQLSDHPWIAETASDLGRGAKAAWSSSQTLGFDRPQSAVV